MNASGIAELKILLKGAGFPKSLSGAFVIQEASNATLEALHKTTSAGEPVNPHKWPLGEWVRIQNSSMYRGDLALVVEVSSNGDIINLLLVPRIFPSVWERAQATQKTLSSGDQQPSTALRQKRKATKPSPRLPDLEHELASLPLVHGYRILNKQRKLYPNGLECVKVFSHRCLNRSHPQSKEEFHPFLASEKQRQVLDLEIRAKGGDPELLHRMKQLAEILPAAICKGYFTIGETTWKEGHCFRVIGLSDYEGIIGRAISIDHENKFVVLQSLEDPELQVEVQFINVAPHRSPGDWVRVAIGPHEGMEGMVVGINGSGREGDITIQQFLEEEIRVSFKQIERSASIQEAGQSKRALTIQGPGDMVKVTTGLHQNKQGVIVSLSGNQPEDEVVIQLEHLPQIKVTEEVVMNGCLEALQGWAPSVKAFPGTSFSGVKTSLSLQGPSAHSSGSISLPSNPKGWNPHRFLGQEVIIFKGPLKGRFGILKDVGGEDGGIEVVGGAGKIYHRVKLQSLIAR